MFKGMLLLFALSHIFWLSLVALLFFGIAQNGVGATTMTLLQTRVPTRAKMTPLKRCHFCSSRPDRPFHLIKMTVMTLMTE
jgi:hypothetical protein